VDWVVELKELVRCISGRSLGLAQCLVQNI